MCHTAPAASLLTRRHFRALCFINVHSLFVSRVCGLRWEQLTHAFHYVLCEQLTCSFLNLSDISSAAGGGRSLAVPTVGRTFLPSPAGTQPRGAHPAPGAVPGQLAQPPNKLAACVQLHAVLPKFLILTASPPALITLELEIVHTNFLE